MFVGHYGPSFAATAIDRSIPLWGAFVAVQFVDVVWALLVLLGIEKVRIVPGITASSPLDLYYMPYTHSLVAALLWAAAAALVYRLLLAPEGWSAAVVIGVAVFSHWILDLLVHRPDLPLYDDTLKVGLGIWNYPVAAFALEAAVLFGGMYLYRRATRRAGGPGPVGIVLVGAVMLIPQVVVYLGPPPSSDREAAVGALAAYAVFAGLAYWLDRTRAAPRRR
jgi:hypothetical protein